MEKEYNIKALQFKSHTIVVYCRMEICVHLVCSRLDNLIEL